MVRVKILKLIAGLNAKEGDVVTIPKVLANDLQKQGVVEIIKDDFEEILFFCGLSNILSWQKEVIRYAKDSFDGIIIDVEWLNK